MQRKPLLEKLYWVAGIIVAIVAVFQIFIRSGYRFQGNQGPIILTQDSRNTTVVINTPPPRLTSDQENCQGGEHWVGFNPNETEFTGSIPKDKFAKAIMHGKFRWSPSTNNARNSTNGHVILAIDGKKTVIYQWSSPEVSVHEFEVPVANYFSDSTGKFSIIWMYTSGNSGICVAKSEIDA